MQKQVIMYSEKDAIACKLCIHAEKLFSEKINENLIICHLNYFKEPDIFCPEHKTNETLMKELEKELL